MKNRFLLQSVVPWILLPLFVLCIPGTFAQETAKQPPILKRYGITYTTQSAEIFNEAVDDKAFSEGSGAFLKDALDKCKAHAERIGKTPNAIGGMAGQWLELALLVVLKHNKIGPVYYQVELQNVPDAIMDVVVFSEKRGPIVLSCKTSLRERYKQADLEAAATRKTYPDSYSCIITVDKDKKHVGRIRKKIEDKELQALDAVYDETDLNEIISLLFREKLIAPTDKVLKKSRLTVK